MKRWKGPGCKIGIKGPYTRRHRTSQYREDIRGFQQEEFFIGVLEESNGDVQRVEEGDRLDSVEGSASSGARKQGLDVVEGSTPSEREEESTSITGNVSVRGTGHLA
jgi:hypothetical protein